MGCIRLRHRYHRSTGMHRSWIDRRPHRSVHRIRRCLAVRPRRASSRLSPRHLQLRQLRPTNCQRHRPLQAIHRRFRWCRPVLIRLPALGSHRSLECHRLMRHPSLDRLFPRRPRRRFPSGRRCSPHHPNHGRQPQVATSTCSINSRRQRRKRQREETRSSI